MKFWPVLFLFAVLFAQEIPSEQEVEADHEIALSEPLSFTESLTDPILPPETLIEQPQKSANTAVFLSSLFPGLGHFYLGEAKVGGGLMGAAGVELGAFAAALYEEQSDAALFSLLTFSNTLNYGVYAAYRDARIINGQEGYKYKMPTDSLADLTTAPFRWSVLRKTEVWGGCLGALALALCINRLVFPPEARITLSSFSDKQVQPWFPAISLPVGIGEESIFRGFIQPLFAETLTPWGSIAATSILFGASHIPNAFLLPKEQRFRYYSFSLPLITGLGAYLGWLAQKNVSLKESVAVHMWYDLTLFSLAALAQSAAIGCPAFTWSLQF